MPFPSVAERLLLTWARLSKQIWLTVLVHPKVCSLGAVGALAFEFYFTSLPESYVHGICHDVQLNHEGEERKRCGEIPRGTSTDYAMLQVRTCNPLWGMSILWT